MQARYAGRCHECSGVITVGSYMYWHKRTKAVRCVDHAPTLSVVDKILALAELRELSTSLTESPMSYTAPRESYKRYGTLH